MNSLIGRLAILLLTLMVTSCSEDAVQTTRYSSFRAHFMCDIVSGVPTAFRACNSIGEWCSVEVDTYSGLRYKFLGQNSSTPDYMNSAGGQYERGHVWVCGLFLGIPTLPEMGYESSILTCYDRVCPNCYYKSSIQKPLEFCTEAGIVECEHCSLRYNLNELGNCTNGKSQPLERYRVSYNGNNTLFVSN